MTISPRMRLRGLPAPRLQMVTCSARLNWIAALSLAVLVFDRSGEPECP